MMANGKDKEYFKSNKSRKSVDGVIRIWWLKPWAELNKDSILGPEKAKNGRCRLDGHFSNLFVVTIVMFVWKDENNWKRGREFLGASK